MSQSAGTLSTHKTVWNMAQIMSILLMMEHASQLRLIGAQSDNFQQLANYFPHSKKYTKSDNCD